MKSEKKKEKKNTHKDLTVGNISKKNKNKKIKETKP
jgi:hypothetical protein